MTDVQFTILSGRLLEEIQKETPRKTGNLQGFATKKEPLGYGKFRIIVDEDIAPYFKYVNGTREKRGSHHGYFGRAVKIAIKIVAKENGGRVEGV